MTQKKNVVDHLTNAIYFALDHPHRALFYVSLVVGVVMRMYFAMTSSGFFHPDETYQSLEPAHYLVYGYGYLPPEFSQNIPNERFYAKSRSWLFPLIFAFFMNVEKALGLDYYSVILPSMFFIGAAMSVMLIFSIRYFVMVLTSDERKALLAASLIAVFPGITKLTSRLLTNTFLLPVLFLAIGRAIQLVQEGGEVRTVDKIVFIAGLGMTTYMRTDLIVPVVFFALYALVKVEENRLVWTELGSFKPIFRSGLWGWIIGMSVDFWIYGGEKLSDFWQVPYNWFGFNIIEGKSKVFGTERYGFYYEKLIVEHGMEIWVVLTAISVILSSLVILYFRNSIDPLIHRKIADTFRDTMVVIKYSLTLVLIWNVYEWPFDGGINFAGESHKEIRFVANAWVLLYVLVGIVTIQLGDVVDFFFSFMSFPKAEVKLKKVSLNGLYAQTATLFFLSMLIFSQIDTSSYLIPEETLKDMNEAVEWVGQQSDSTGIVIFLPWYYAGGYTHLHKDIPIAFVTDTDSIERIESYLVSSPQYNYVVIPKYMKSRIPQLQHILLDNGWEIAHVSRYYSEVWVRA